MLTITLLEEASVRLRWLPALRPPVLSALRLRLQVLSGLLYKMPLNLQPPRNPPPHLRDEPLLERSLFRRRLSRFRTPCLHTWPEAYLQ